MPEEEKKKPRDTQFVGFAKLLLPEILDEIEAVTERTVYLPIEGRQLVEKVIAQRAYSLAYHVLSTAEIDPCGMTPGQLIASIPDMIEAEEDDSRGEEIK